MACLGLSHHRTRRAEGPRGLGGSGGVRSDARFNKVRNLASRFLLELCALGTLGYWGFKTGGGTIAKVGLGIGVPLLAAVVCGTFVAPNAPVSMPVVLSLLLQVMIFGLAAASLAATGHPRLTWAFVAVVAINAILMYVWEQ